MEHTTMKLTGILLENWMCHARTDVPVTPLTLICGPNGSGKSAIADGLAYALTSDLRRVHAKGERDKLIREGADAGKVTLKFADSLIGRDVKSGKLGPSGRLPTQAKDATALPYVLEPSLFANQDPDARRVVLLKMMGVAIDGPAIMAELKARGRCVDLMGSSFRHTDAIEKWYEAANKATTEARGMWKGITGENYGSVKAADWKAETPADVPTEGEVADVEALLNQTESDMNVLQRTLGMIEQAENGDSSIASMSARRMMLQDKANLLPAAEDHLAARREDAGAAQVELERLDATLADIRNRQPGRPPLNCPHCGCDVTLQGDALEPYTPPEDPSTPAELAAAVEARRVGADAVYAAKGLVLRAEGAVQEARAAKGLLTAGDEAGDLPEAAQRNPILPTRADTEGQIASTNTERAALRAKLEGMRATLAAVERAEATTKKAQEAHQKVLSWIAIAESLAPDGIVADLLGKALTPLNDALRDLAAKFQWPQPRVMDDMRITIDGREYGLWAESMRWRADVILAIAIAAHTKLRMVALDRFDVLEVPARGPAMGVLYTLTRGKDAPLDTCILIGTLKAPPKTPPDVKVTWLGEAPAAPALKVVA
jgi:energy-coupling factor transporter ATP-binding protein EcfA2